MTYLIVGVDRRTFARWHENVTAGDPPDAARIAQARARVQGIDLVVAAGVGAYSSIVEYVAPRRNHTASSSACSARSRRAATVARCRSGAESRASCLRRCSSIATSR